ELEETRHGAQQGRLAAPVRRDKTDMVAIIDNEIEVGKQKLACTVAGIAEADHAHDSRSLVRRRLHMGALAIRSAPWLGPGRLNGQTRGNGTVTKVSGPGWSALQLVPQGLDGSTGTMRLKNSHATLPFAWTSVVERQKPNCAAEAAQVRSCKIE